MANSSSNSKNKRKSLIQDGASAKKRKTSTVNKMGSKDTQNKETSKKDTNIPVEMMERLEEELKCNICTEVLIKPTVLNCSHMFCEYCIIKWKKQQGRCPICRDRIDSEIRVLALDIFIEKALELLSPEQKKARQDIVNQREKYTRQRPRRSQRLKNRTVLPEVTVSTDPAEESSFHLRALIDEVLHLANHFTYD